MIASPNFRRPIRILALACTLAIAGCSGGEPAPEEPSTDNQAIEGQVNPLFYEIANAEGEIEGWILGTIHALPDGTKWRTPAIDVAIEQADHLLVEIANLDDQSSIAATFGELATAPDSGPLFLRVRPELRAPLDEMIELSEIPPAQFSDTETWAAALLIARVGAVGNPRNGVDRFLIHMFEDRGVVGFEEAAEQLGIFDQLAPQDQRDLLEGTVSEWMKSRENPGWLTQAWLSGDLAALEEATASGIMADKELRDALLVNRNSRWMPALLSNLRQTDTVFVAVGTAHIIGPDGLPALLEPHGYSVRRIN